MSLSIEQIIIKAMEVFGNQVDKYYGEPLASRIDNEYKLAALDLFGDQVNEYGEPLASHIDNEYQLAALDLFGNQVKDGIPLASGITNVYQFKALDKFGDQLNEDGIPLASQNINI